MYARPLVQQGTMRPAGAVPLAGGAIWFTHVELLQRNAASRIMPAQDLPDPVLDRLTAPREPMVGLDLSQPRIMGILNVTPDSFSDGGVHFDPDIACKAALNMAAQGAAMIDIGGESTRPGAEYVPQDTEIARTAPVIRAVSRDVAIPLSIDTRKTAVAEAALDAGAALVNDVSGFTHDAALAAMCAARQVPVCVMHAQGDPATMQQDPQYENVLLDVYDFLEAQITRLEQHGIARARILADPGIGFGKNLAHNLTLLRNISLFHGLGCAILLGVSRKRFIGTIGQAAQADARVPGSIAVGLAGVAQGVQILRVHDVAETVQALRLWQATR
ncbi:dihydropteroate synthase [Rhodobacteraceae bacterium F11138]|nr:dihydropteroate synthase [Rhodobacteraceae bacterium F11138]